MAPRSRPTIHRIGAALAVCLMASVAPGDLITLNNGREIEGVIVFETASRVVLRTTGGELAIARSDIRTIQRDTPEDNALLRAETALRSRNATGSARLFREALDLGATPSQILEVFQRNRPTLEQLLASYPPIHRPDLFDLMGALARSELTPGELVLMARLYFQLGAHAESLGMVRRAENSGHEWNDFDSQWIIGFLKQHIRGLLARGQFQEAVDHVEHLRSFDPGSADNYVPLVNMALAADARDRNDYETAMRILAEDLMPEMPGVATNRLEVVTRQAVAWAIRGEREREMRRLVTTYVQPYLLEVSVEATDELIESEVTRYIRARQPALAIRLIETMYRGREVPERIERLGVEADFDLKHEAIAPGDAPARVELALWAADKQLYQRALSLLEEARENPHLRDLANHHSDLIIRERDLALLRQALAAYEAGRLDTVLEVTAGISLDEGNYSDVMQQVLELAEIARRDRRSAERRRPYEAEALYQSAERNFLLQRVEESWKTLQVILDQYPDTPAGDRASNLMPQVQRAYQMQLLESGRDPARAMLPPGALPESSDLENSAQMERELQDLLDRL